MENDEKVTDVAVLETEEQEITEPWYEKQINLEDAKLFIKANMATAARSFIAIGFYLKRVRDQELFAEDGYENIWDFAKAEYGISKSTASRYMDMNDKFSVDGNSPILQNQYRDFDKSKLQEMLYLNDEQLREVHPEHTVREIRAIRTPKEIPYFELPGQMDIESDFPEIMPGDFFANRESLLPAPAAQVSIPVQTFAMNISDMIPEANVAMSQQENVEPEIAIFMQAASDQSDMNEIVDAADVQQREEITTEPVTQADLPILKNNDMRAAFVADYCTWPLWIETEQTGERYYRYNFDNGESFVIKQYFHRLFNYESAAKKWEDRYSDGWGSEEYYILKPERHFKDCQTNRSQLIEYLKNLQKKESA